ncbi:MAG TPA: AAA family ATPase [Bacteroidales bacterium]|nr:AAA family ATPase [Bacteroidales bacterium]
METIIADSKQKATVLINQINSEVSEFDNNSENSSDLLVYKSGNEWIQQAKKKKVPNMIFDSFWFENEICFLFADTGIGKTILGVQIADSISTGKSILGFRMNIMMQIVLYLDFELSDKQFENRYSNNYQDHYIWSDNFKRVEFNTDAEITDYSTFENDLINEIEKIIIQTGVRILIVDNLTYLNSDNEQAKHALPFMKKLKNLKKKYDLSILILAHTPKRNNTKPLTRNDLSGSKMLINFCDSAFAIGESSQDVNLRYLKQIKVRSTNCVYDSENVVLCRLVKNSNFIEFEFIKYCSENDHLQILTPSEKTNRIKDALEMKKVGKSNVEIAKVLMVSEGAVRKWIKNDQKNLNSDV